MDPVSCLYNFLSIGIICYFVIICFLIKKCCMNCGDSCGAKKGDGSGNRCQCFQKTYEGEITPSNHVIVTEGNERVPIYSLLNQEDNEGAYVIGDDGVLYRNEACRACCAADDVSEGSCNSREDVFIIRAEKSGRGDLECPPCSPKGSLSGSHVSGPDGRSQHSASQKTSQLGASNFSVSSELQGVICPDTDVNNKESGIRAVSFSSRHELEPSKSASLARVDECPLSVTASGITAVESVVESERVSISDVKPCPQCPFSRSGSASRLGPQEGTSLSEIRPCVQCPLSPFGSRNTGPKNVDSGRTVGSSEGLSPNSSIRPQNISSGVSSASTKSGLQSKSRTSSQLSCSDKCPSPSAVSSRRTRSQTGEKEFSPHVSIKQNLDVITPDGIRSAPTFADTASGVNSPNSVSGKSCKSCSNRRSSELCDEYKNETGVKRKPSKNSTDYKDASESNRGTKAARFSLNAKDDPTSPISEYSGYVEDRSATPGRCSKSSCNSRSKPSSGSDHTSSAGKKSCSKCSEKRSAARGSVGKTMEKESDKTTKPYSTPCGQSKSGPSSASSKCMSSICSRGASSKVSTGVSKTSAASTRASSLDPRYAQSDSSGPCNLSTCKSSMSKTYSPSSSKSDSEFGKSSQTNAPSSSVTTADVDDYQEAGPQTSKCEALDASQAASSCTKIRKGVKDSVCPAIDCTRESATCRTGGFAPIDQCPSVRILIGNVDEIDNKPIVGNVGASQETCGVPTCPGEYKKRMEKLAATRSSESCGVETCPTVFYKNKMASASATSSMSTTCGKPSCPSVLLKSKSSTYGKHKGMATKSGSDTTTGRETDAGLGSGQKGLGSGQQGLGGVDANVIREISTKVQSCLQHARAIAAKIEKSDECHKYRTQQTMRVRAKSVDASSRTQPQTVQVSSKIMLRTTGVTINEYSKIPSTFTGNPGIHIEMVNARGKVQHYKKSYNNLLPSDGAPINIRVRSPCKTTAKNELCVSTDVNPCCSDMAQRGAFGGGAFGGGASSSADDGSCFCGKEYKPNQNQNQIQRNPNMTGNQNQRNPNMAGNQNRRNPNMDESQDTSDSTPSQYRPQNRPQNAGPLHSSQETSSADSKAVTVYRPNSKPGHAPECSPKCATCSKKTCPKSKQFKGRPKPVKFPVYNVTTSYFSKKINATLNPQYLNYVKGMPLNESWIFDHYIYLQDRNRDGDSYFKKRREMIKKIKCKCPWTPDSQNLTTKREHICRICGIPKKSPAVKFQVD